VHLEQATSDGTFILSLRGGKVTLVRPLRAIEVLMGPSTLWAVRLNHVLLSSFFMILKVGHTPCYHIWAPLEVSDEGESQDG